MVLEGVVTNVAASFGAFVDVGVHQDRVGLHISAMANAYVKDPRKIAKPGDVVRVKVLEGRLETPSDLVNDAARSSSGSAAPTTASAEVAPGGIR